MPDPPKQGIVDRPAIRTIKSNNLAAFLYTPAGSFLMILIFSAFTVLLPVYLGGSYANMDMRAHLSFADELRKALASGTLLPSWSNDFDGLGSLAIRLYPPLSSYLTAFIQVLTGDWYFSVLIYYFGWMVVGCWGCFLFVAEYADRKYALLAGLLAAIAPFPLIEIYRFSLYSEFAAGSVVPFCFYFCNRVIAYQKWRDAIWLSAALSIILLTHIPTAIFTGLTLSAYVALLVSKAASARTLMMLLSSVLLSISATAFYWIRLVTELDWLAHNNSEYHSGMFSYTHWLFPASIGVGTPGFMFLYRRIDALVVVQLGLLTPSLLILLFKGAAAIRERWVMFGLSGCSLLALFMISKPSSIIWEHSDVLQKTQFPWRWLAVISPLVIIAFALGIAALRILRPDYKSFWTVAILLAIFLSLAYDIRLNLIDVRRLSKAEFEQNFTPEYSSLGEDHIMWWPVWARAGALDEAGKIRAEDRAVEVYQWSAAKRDFTVGSGQPTAVRVPTFYYPYWKAVVNGNPAEIGRDQLGLILIPVGADRSDIELVFDEPLKNRIAAAVSVAAWAVILLGGIWVSLSGWRRRKVKSVDRYKNSELPANDSC